jgi:hypothetical protein
MQEDNSSQFSLPAVDGSVPAPAVPAPMPAAVPMQNTGQPSMQQSIAAALPMDAQDIDLIEKAWVEKAKMIVARTHGDPYTQNKALSQVKADYIQKRYGKEIKVSE